MLLLFDIGLRICPFPTLQSFAHKLSRNTTWSAERSQHQISLVLAAVNRARYNHLYPMTCLRRSLALQRMLAKEGIATDLKIGVRKDGRQISAHAWLEYEGKTLGEAEKIIGNFVTLEKDASISSSRNL